MIYNTSKYERKNGEAFLVRAQRKPVCLACTITPHHHPNQVSAYQKKKNPRISRLQFESQWPIVKSQNYYFLKI